MERDKEWYFVIYYFTVLIQKKKLSKSIYLRIYFESISSVKTCVCEYSINDSKMIILI